MIRLASLLLVALSASPALAGEAKEGPSEAARAVAALEGRLADLLKEGTAYEHADRYEALLAEASQVAGKHAGEPDAARAYLVIARCCEALGKHPEKEVAFQHYVEALAKYSKEEAATALRREIDGLVGRRELYVAIKTIQLMLSKFPDGPEAAYALYRLGTCHLWMDQPDEAVPAFAEMLQRWPESEVAVQARLRLARCYFLQGKAGETVALLEAFLAKNPNAPQRDAMLFDVAVAHTQSRDYYGALVAFQRLIHDAPNSPYVEAARASVAKLRSDVLQPTRE